MTRYATSPTKPPYWALELLVERLAERVAELEGELERACCPQPEFGTGDPVADIRALVCERLVVSTEALDAPGRTARIAWARQVAMYLARELTDATLPAIGRAFGGRDHTTVLHACRRVSERIATDADAYELVRGLRIGYGALRRGAECAKPAGRLARSDLLASGAVA